MHRTSTFLARTGLASAITLGLLAGCGPAPEDEASGKHVLPESEAAQYPTAYLAEVVPAPEGDDLAEGAGEYVVVANNADIRTDMGGWYIEDSDGNRLPLGIGRQVDVGAELRVHPSCGQSTDEVVFACVGTEVLDDDGDELVMHDSAGGEVAVLSYGGAGS